MTLPLNAHKTLDKADAKTHKRNDDKHQKQRVRSNSTDKRADPLNSLSNKTGNITKDSSDSDSSFLQKHPFQNRKKNYVIWIISRIIRTTTMRKAKPIK